jgi:hypothetical protein
MLSPGSDQPPADDRSWAHLDKLKVGTYGEYHAKMALVRAGFDVYSPEVDDKAIDLVLRVPGSPPRYLDVQVKTVRTVKPTYVFMRKRTSQSRVTDISRWFCSAKARSPHKPIRIRWAEPTERVPHPFRLSDELVKSFRRSPTRE